MIPCPSCGARNRRGSKYCYRCGQRLDVVFDVSCPACDRLNPGGSAFCAFCGGKLPVSIPVAEPTVAEQPVQSAQESRESKPTTPEPAATWRRELPPWLYEAPVETAEAAALAPTEASSSVASPATEQSKYLHDIPGALPKTQGWLSSVPKPAAKPPVTQTPQSRAKAQKGCLTLALPVFLVVAALALLCGF